MTTSTRGAVAPVQDDEISPELDERLRSSQAIIDVINAQLPKGASQLQPIPKSYRLKRADKEAVSVAIHAAFDLRGGVPGLVAFAADHPREFYALWAKLLPSGTETPIGATTVVFNSAIPQTALDRVTIDERGRVLTVDADGPEVDDEELPE